MNNQDKEIYVRSLELYQRMQVICDDIRSKLMSETPQNLADTAYALREAAKHLEAATKVLNAESRVIAQAVSLMWSMGDGDIIRTEYCHAIPDPKPRVLLANRHSDPEAYDKLLEFFGVPAEYREQDMVRFNWTNLGDWVGRLMKEGKPTPPGITPEKVLMEPRLRITAKAPIAMTNIAGANMVESEVEVTASSLNVERT